jgi:DnaJ-class molecular chaperone
VPLVLNSLSAKRYHPDSIDPETTDQVKQEQEGLFKEITEAYSVIGEVDSRNKYDKLIFGSDTVNTSQSFEN